MPKIPIGDPYPPETPGFNDIFTDAQGRVYAGSMRTDPFRAEGERTPGELWRIDGPDRAVRLYGDVSLSNGIGFVLSYMFVEMARVWY